jgi:hypothetical protein
VESAEASVGDLQKLHRARHSGKSAYQTKLASFSVDGVPESKQQSVDIVSLIFAGCRTVYTVKICKKMKAFKEHYTPDFLLTEFINQCHDCDVQVPICSYIGCLPVPNLFLFTLVDSSNSRCAHACVAQKTKAVQQWTRVRLLHPGGEDNARTKRWKQG